MPVFIKAYYAGSPDHVADAGTWTKPVGLLFARVILIGAGGSGGGGDKQASGTAIAGGGGGGGGSRHEMIFQAADLGSTEPYSVGAGASGGVAGTGSNGGNGTAGGNSTFGGGTVPVQTAYGGGAGRGSAAG